MGRLVTAVTVTRVAIVAAVLLLAAAPALAHTVLVGSDPSGDETVTGSLADVRLAFSEPVTDPEVDVTGPAGGSVTDGPAAVDGVVVLQPLQVLDEHGAYVVSYRVVAADGHPIEGELVFHYAGPLPAPPAEPAEPVEPVEEPASDTSPPLGLGALGALLAVVVAAVVRFLRAPA